MTPRARKRRAANGLALLEESAQVLRGLPASAWAPYGYGSLPFALGVLYFWTDMSRSAFADGHLGEAALGLGALYIWMKAWQAEFARRVRAVVAAELPPRWEWRRWARGLLIQGALQPLGLLFIPLTLTIVLPALMRPGLVMLTPLVLVLAVPFAWVYAFFQNVTVLDDASAPGLRALFARAWSEAARAPRQSIEGILLIEVFAVFVMLNWISAGYLLPMLAKSLLGLESVITRSPQSIYNSTFFAATAVLTYLSVDPIAKTFYLLRCYYSAARTTGGDLHAALKRAAATSTALAALALTFVVISTTPRASAAEADPSVPVGAETSPGPDAPSAPKIESRVSDGAGDSAQGEPAPPQAVSEGWVEPVPETFAPAVAPTELDRALSEVITQRKFAWRSPRERVAEDEEPGVVVGFLDEVAQTIRRFIRRAIDWLDDMFSRRNSNPRPMQPEGGQGVDWMSLARLMLIVVLFAVAAALGVMLFRWWRGRGRGAMAPISAVAGVPDIADENVGADQLPEDGWARLARELLARGEFRLALRALYLSSLAHLASRGLIRLAKFKSNRDYERELRRRGHARPEVTVIFSENVSLFDSVWYGSCPVGEALIGRFAANVDKLKGAA